MATVRSAETERTTERDRESAVQPVEKERWLGAQPIGLLFITPYVLFLAAIFVYPLIVQFFISFKDYFFAAPGATVDRPWVGFQNYVDVIQDPTFQRSLFNVFEFMIINVPATVFLSLVLAYALNSKMRGLSFFRGAYYAPYVTASVAIVTVWLFMFGETGLVNTVLGSLAPDPSWLINRYWAMPMIAVFVTWKQLGFFILPYVVFLAFIFVYPLIVQFFISFKDYFFAAPGATVERPWVGLENYVDVLKDPTFQRSIC